MTKTDARERCVLLFFEAEQKDMEVSKVVAELKVAPEPYCLKILQDYEANEEKHCYRSLFLFTGFTTRREFRKYLLLRVKV